MGKNLIVLCLLPLLASASWELDFDEDFAAAASAEKPDVVMDGLVAWWKLDEGVGTTAYDSSGNGRHGTLVNSPVWTNGLNGGAALSFNNGVANQEVSITNFPANGSNPVTVMAFGKARLPQLAGYGIMAGWGIGAPGQLWYVGWVVGGSGVYPAYGGGTYGGDIGSGVTDTNAFHHIAISYAGGSSGAVKLYADGAETYTGTATLNLPASFKIGRGSDGETPRYFFNGTICQIRVYNRALSSNEVSTIYNRYK